MKSRTYFGFALLFPYLLWIVCALIVFLLSARELSGAWNLALLPITFYTWGIIYWLAPYTVLAIGLWFWSKNKSVAALYKVSLFAPVLLFILLFIETTSIFLPVENIAELFKLSLLMGGLSLLFGYLSVGVALGLFKYLQSKKLVVEGEPPLLLPEQ